MSTPNFSPNVNTPNAALLELEAKFSHWRKNKTYARETVPIELLQAAQALTQHIEDKTIRTRLGISYEQLKRAEPTNPDFVQVDTQDAHLTEIDPICVEIHFSSGARVSIDGLKHKPQQILSQLMEHVYDCP